MKPPAISAFCGLSLFLAGCAKLDIKHPDTSDTIGGVVKEESGHVLFPSGVFQPILLPASTPVAVVTSNALACPLGPTIRPVKKFTIVEAREVLIREDQYTALRVHAGHRDMVVLLKFDRSIPPTGAWWSRVYENE